MSVKAISGRNAVLEFYKLDGYYPIACAENISIEFSMDVKSVKTIGDGANQRVRGARKSYSITCDGVVAYDTSNVQVWDIYEHYRQMTDVLFRIVFRDDNDGLIKVIFGEALPTNIRISAPNDFVGQSLQFAGNGEPDIRNTLSQCDASITTLSLNSQTSNYISFEVSGFSSDTRRIEYSVDGGGRRSMVITPGSLLKLIGYSKYSQISAGAHVLTVWPMCESGDYGTEKTLNFTVT